MSSSRGFSQPANNTSTDEPEAVPRPFLPSLDSVTPSTHNDPDVSINDTGHTRPTSSARQDISPVSTELLSAPVPSSGQVHPTPKASASTIAPKAGPGLAASSSTLFVKGGSHEEVPPMPQSSEKHTHIHDHRHSDPEPVHDAPKTASLLRVTFDDVLLTPAVLHHNYSGGGTEEDPYIAEFIKNDPRDPSQWSNLRKWTIAVGASIATFVVAFCSSTYSSVTTQIMTEFHQSTVVVTLGLSLFVVGYAVGPVIFAPMSELYGRRSVNILTFTAMLAFNAGATGANNITTLLVCRLLGGVFGSGPMTNASGVLADMFAAEARGLAMAIFCAAVFIGPTLGPVIGGFLGEAAGWRWVLGLMTAATGLVWLWTILGIPETYSPVLLERRARALQRKTGKPFATRLQLSGRRPSPSQAFRIALSRPWILLFREPIVTLLSFYVAVIYGTLYLFFGAFPIVYTVNRGWSLGTGSLPFLGLVLGMLSAVIYTARDNSTRYLKLSRAASAYNGEPSGGGGGGGGGVPEDRLPPAIIGSVCLPVGLFIFAWTNGPEIHWVVSVLATLPFGFGMTLVFLAVANYLIDSYVIYAASVIAANSIIRSLFGAAFPLFTPIMYRELGIHWASSVPAFLALVCMPLPWLFYRYGRAIRARCRYSREAAEMLAQMMKKAE